MQGLTVSFVSLLNFHSTFRGYPLAPHSKVRSSLNFFKTVFSIFTFKPRCDWNNNDNKKNSRPKYKNNNNDDDDDENDNANGNTDTTANDTNDMTTNHNNQ